MTAREDWPNVVDLTTAAVVSLGRRDALNEMFDEIDNLRARSRCGECGGPLVSKCDDCGTRHG